MLQDHGGVELGTETCGSKSSGTRRSTPLSIACKELVPILLACVAWGHNWQGCRVICHCDNTVVVAGLRLRSSRDKGVMHLLRCLVFVEGYFGCYIVPEYINTRNNHLADNLSRNLLPSFFSKVPEACCYPTPTSRQLLDLLLNLQADWISLQWCRQFSTIFRRVCTVHSQAKTYNAHVLMSFVSNFMCSLLSLLQNICCVVLPLT